MLNKQMLILIFSLISSAASIAGDIKGYGMISGLNLEQSQIEIDDYIYDYSSDTHVKNKNGFAINHQKMQELLVKDAPVKYEATKSSQGNPHLKLLKLVDWNEYNSNN